ncbi:hypothetical protein [Streptomyces sp. MUM 2J]|uniref:hypothetical protein n=1 Tax=Streptomyces sp. MUM 2J TaxID=2791987 RepID=UPI001F049EFF|nr:hypothetical protein [Streptomyces sp. MUM 2J]MCH0566157.1 hypothetical protein [Streptomyces sp. MUM 2J]
MHADASPVDLRPGPAHRDWARRLAALSSGEAACTGREIEYSCRELGIWQYTDLVPVQPFVVDAASGRTLDRLNSQLTRLLVDHAVDISAGDFGRLADHTGVPQDARWFLPAAQPLGRVLGCSRADVLVESGQPKFLEFNFGACLNGATPTPVLTEALFKSGPGIEARRAHGIGAQSTFAARLSWIVDQLPEPGGRVALLGFPWDGDEGSLRAFELEAAYHSAHGVPCDFVPFDEVEIDAGGLHWQGVTYAAAVKYFMASERVVGEHADRLVALEQSGVPLFGGQLAALFTSKALLADLFQRTDLTAEQQRLLDHVPWTARLQEGPARRQGALVDATEWAASHRENAVLKPCNAFGSRGVVLGSVTPAGEWERLLKDAVASDDYVVQEAVEADPWPLLYWDRQREELTEVTAPVLLGPFRVGERSAGCYTKQPRVNEAARLLRHRDGVSFGCVVTAGEDTLAEGHGR